MPGPDIFVRENIGLERRKMLVLLWQCLILETVLLGWGFYVGVGFGVWVFLGVCVFGFYQFPVLT